MAKVTQASGTKTTAPTALSGGALKWTANGITYVYSPSSGAPGSLNTLVVTDTSSGDSYIINNFDLQAAQASKGGFDGISLSNLTATKAGTGANPITKGGAVPANASINATGNEQTVTVYASAAQDVAQTITVNVTGGTSIYENTGAGFVPASGPLTLTIPAGADSVSFGLVDTSTSKQSQTVQVSSILASDAAVSNTLSVTFAGDPYTPPVTTDALNGTFVQSAITRAGQNLDVTYYSSHSDGDLGDSGSYVVNTGSGANKITLTNNGANAVAGGSGNDTIEAYGTNNKIMGNGGQDIITLEDAPGSTNNIYVSGVTDVATAISQARSGVATNTMGTFVSVLEGNDTIIGDNRNDAIFVGTGNDVIVMGAGNSNLMAGLDVKTADYNWTYTAATSTWSNVDWQAGSALAPPNYYGEAYMTDGVKYEAGGGNDTIFGGSGNEGISLSNGNNYVDAGSGNDTIQAGSGQNTIFGGTGNDTIAGGGGSSYIDAESGNDLIALNGGSSTVYGGTGNSTIYSGDYGNDWATSESANKNIVNAGNGNTVLYGSAGNDTLNGGKGNDTIWGGAGNEAISAGDGGDTANPTTITVGTGDTTVTGGAGVDRIFGGKGNDVLNAGSGGSGKSSDDFTYLGAGEGNTTINGGDGIDHIVGSDKGSNVITIGNGGTDSMPSQVTLQGGNATVTGGSGVDYIFGGAGSASITMGDGGDATTASQAVAGLGDTKITGGAGYDNMFAGAGNATLIAGSGTDQLTGGAGHTTFQINGNAGNVVISGAASGDTLIFGSDVSIADLTVTTGTYADNSGNVIGSTTIVTLNQGGTITILGNTLTQATFADGEGVTFAQLLSPAFTVGNTMYSSTDQGLGNSSGASPGNSPSNSGNAATFFEGSQSGTQAATQATAQTDTSSSGGATTTQNLTLTGMRDLSGTGNNVDDVITANGGNDTLIAGTANNTLVGGGASDLYVVSAGTGTTTTIKSSTGSDVLEFVAGITLANLTLTTSSAADGSLIVSLKNSQGGTVVIDGAINADGTSTMLDQIAFADGSSASLAQLLAQLKTGPTASNSAANVTLAGGVQNMSLTGSANVSATGNAQDDVISANSGNDTLIAGSAYDTLIGGAGHTAYLVNANDANVVIANSGSGDVLAFDSSVTQSNLTTTSAVVNGQTVVTIADSIGTTVTIQGGSLSQVSFADGSMASVAQLLSPGYTRGSTSYSQVSATAGAGITTLAMTGNNAVTATANSGNDILISNVGNDTLVAGTGTDTLVGGGVSDTYTIANGNQVTTIEQSSMFDTLGFGTGVSLADLSAMATTVTGGMTDITLTNSLGGTVLIVGSSGAPVDKIAFADGSTGSIGEILAQATTGSSVATSATTVTLPYGIQNMTLTGSANVTATGNSQPDVIAANSGNDTLVAGAANDTLIGGAGATTYDVGSGNDIHILNTGINDVLNLAAGISESDLTTTSSTVGGQTVTTLVSGQGGTITIQGALNNINFADGSTATVTQLLAPSYTEGTTLYSQVSATATGSINTIDLTGNGAISATGSSTIASTLQGNSGNDTLTSGTGGNDTLIGGDGNTTYQIGAGTGNTTIENSWAGDTLSFTKSTTAAVSLAAQTYIAADGSTEAVISVANIGYVAIDNYQNGVVDTIQFVSGNGPNISLAELVAQATAGSSAATSAIDVTLPGGIQNMTLTDSGNITATGNNLANVITANVGNDTLIAGTGNDTLKSSSSSGTVGVTTFQINAGSGNVIIPNSHQSDILSFGAGITAANLQVTDQSVNGVNTAIFTESDGKTVTVLYNGLTQVDFADGTSSTLSALATRPIASAVSVVMPSGVTQLILTGTANISGTGNTLADTITANSGNDTLISGGAGSTLIGGTGNDTFVVSHTSDVVQAQANAAGGLVIASANYTMPANIHNMTGAAGSLVLTGNNLDNVITAGSGYDTLTAGSGNTTLIGGTGTSVMNGNGANTQFIVNTETANTVINGINGNTLQFGASVNEQDISNVSYTDGYYYPTVTITFKSGATVSINGTAGADVNQIIGNYHFADGQSYSLSNLMLTYATQPETVSGHFVANQLITGGAGNDDVILSGGTNDTIIGGAGNDNMQQALNPYPYPGTAVGGDTFVFRKGDGQDIVLAEDYSYLDTSYTIYTSNSSASGTMVTPAHNVFSFGPGIASSDLSVVVTEGANSTALPAVKLVTAYGDSVALLGTYYYAALGHFYNGSTALDLLSTPSATTLTFSNGTSETWAQFLAATTVTVNSASNFTLVELNGGTNQQNLNLTGTADLMGTGGSMNSVITANSGNDTLTGGSGLTTLVGGTGNDTLIAGSGLATLIGGTGVNTYEVTNSADVINTQAGGTNGGIISTASYVLPSGFTSLTGGAWSISLTGNGQNDTLTSFSKGADSLIAGSGLATLVGSSAGDDTFEINNASDVITIPSAATRDTVITSVNYTAPAAVNTLTGTGSGNLVLTDNTASSTITGNSGNDTLSGNGGNDTLVAGSGLTTMTGGGGNDTFMVNNIGDVVNETAVTGTNLEQTTVNATQAANISSLVGTGSGNLTLKGNSQNGEIVNQGTGNDMLIAGTGNDELLSYSGSGPTTMVGGAGNDTFTGAGTSNTFDVNVGNGALTIDASQSGDVLVFGPGITASSITGSTSTSNGTTIDTLSIAGGNTITIDNPAFNTVKFNDGTSTTLTALTTVTSITSSVSIVMPAGATKLTLTGTGNISGTGNNLADTIIANSGNDALIAGSGLATLVGGTGIDTFVVNRTADIITQATANASDIVQTTASYTLPANLSTLTGTGSADIVLTGNNLTDKITSNSGVDTLVGGTGNDTFIINNSSDVIAVSTAKAGNVTQSTVDYVLPTNLLNLTGTGSKAITLTGNTLADTITANSGNDMLVSGSGIDTLVGGAGNDTFVIKNSSDAITVTTAKAGNVVQSTVDYVLPVNLLNLTGIGSNAIKLTGNASADTITANSGNDTLTAGSGLATMIGGAGNDTFVVNSASDVITEAANTGNNTEQTLVSITLAANLQNLTGIGTTAIKLTGNSGTDVITGNPANDTLVAGSGSDTLIAGTGSAKTTFTGGAGNDVFVINNTADVITAVAGSNVNTIQSSVSYTAPTNVQDLFLTGTGSLSATANSGNSLLIGNTGADTLTGGTGVDVLEAGSGADVLKDTGGANAMIAGAGNDSMTGGTGTSFMVGGAGNDAITLGAGTAVVAFNTGAGKTTIAPGTGVSNVLSLGGGIAYANLAFSKSGNNLILNTGGNNAITFTNWYVASADHNFVTLQVIEQSAATYSATSANVLYNSEVEEFSFTQLVAAFNTALAANPSLTSWNLSNALLTDHLSSSNTTALGGDLAYYDGLNGNLAGLNLATAVTTLQSSSFGKTAQSIDAWSGISNGTNKLH